jgi:hypothetical protein
MKPTKLLQQLGGQILVDSIGWRGAAALMERHGAPRSWQRIKRELRGLPSGQSPAFSALAAVDKALTEFEPLRLEALHNPLAKIA